MHAHMLLDDGFDYCGACDAAVPAGAHCGGCGAPLREASAGAAEARTARRCPSADCDTVTRSTFCSSCGSRVVPREVERVERGETTWAEILRDSNLRWAERVRRAAPPPPDAAERREISRWPA